METAHLAGIEVSGDDVKARRTLRNRGRGAAAVGQVAIDAPLPRHAVAIFGRGGAREIAAGGRTESQALRFKAFRAAGERPAANASNCNCYDGTISQKRG